MFPYTSFAISGISILDAITLANVSSLGYLKALAILVKRNTSFDQNSAIASAFSLFNGSEWSVPSISLPLEAMRPTSDFIWALKLVEPSVTEMFVAFDDINVSVLDVLPSVQAFSSSDAAFTGSNISVECVPIVQSRVFFLPLFTAANVTNTSCVFLTTSSRMQSFSHPAHFVFVSQSLITLLCDTLSTAQLGPPFSVWKLRVVFPDGRESPASSKSLTVRCPAGMYIETNTTATCVAPPCCLTCPSPMSTSFGLDGIGIHTCICRAGYYGVGECKRCPQLSGYNCTTPNQALPIVLPGYYGDYSLLPQCDWHATSCAALLTCPYGERSCPGGGDKLCTQTDSECYTGLACSTCCSLYFSESSICQKCPDQSTSTTIIAGMVIVVIIVAILTSTSQSASFTHSIKYAPHAFLHRILTFCACTLF